MANRSSYMCRTLQIMNLPFSILIGQLLRLDEEITSLYEIFRLNQTTLTICLLWQEN